MCAPAARAKCATAIGRHCVVHSATSAASTCQHSQPECTVSLGHHMRHDGMITLKNCTSSSGNIAGMRGRTISNTQPVLSSPVPSQADEAPVEIPEGSFAAGLLLQKQQQQHQQHQQQNPSLDNRLAPSQAHLSAGLPVVQFQV